MQRRFVTSALLTPIVVAGVSVAAGAPATAAPATPAAAGVCTPVGAGLVISRSGAPIATLDAAQARNARVVVAQGLRDGVPQRGLAVALATALVESGLRNLASQRNPGSLQYPHDGVAAGDHDSVGLFQQRDAWGSMAVRMDPARSAHLFFTGGAAGQRGLIDVAGWQALPIGQASQAVQSSAFPSRYETQSATATAAVRAILDEAAAARAAKAAPAPARAAATSSATSAAQVSPARATARAPRTPPAPTMTSRQQRAFAQTSAALDRARKAVAAARDAVRRAQALTGDTSGSSSASLPVVAGVAPGAVLYVGDSLAVGTGAHLAQAGIAATVDAREGRSTAEGIAALRTYAVPPATVVVDLGTNDGPNARTFRLRVLELLRAAPGSEVFWLTNHRPGREALDAELQRVAAVHPRLHVVREDAWIATRRDLVAGDGIHLSDTGYAQRAALIATSIAPAGTGCVATTGTSGWTTPVAAGSYTLTARFGDVGPHWSSGRHTGLDLAAPAGTPVRAATSGTVRSAGPAGPYGNLLVLDSPDGVQTWYAHQSSFAPGIAPGVAVTAGQVIGSVGMTGNATGPHLHFEVHVSGRDVDPEPWLASHGAPV